MAIKKLCLVVWMAWGITFVFGQDQSKELLLQDKIQPLSQGDIFRHPDYYQWGSSIIQDDVGQYHLFYSRWKREYGFTGWLTHSEIAHAVSDKPTGPWKYRGTVLRGRGKGHWDAVTAHNPKIKKFGNQYYLYYISTHMNSREYDAEDLIETAKVGYTHPNWKILRPNQRTGVAVSTILHGPWERSDAPLLEPAGPIITLTVNPAIAEGGNGKYYLIVKGDKPDSSGQRNQAIAISNSPAGPFEIQEKAVIDHTDAEDISLWYDSVRHSFYAIFHAHTFIGMISSFNGVDWKPASEYKVLTGRKVLRADGTYLVADRLERPFIFVEDNKPRVLSLAVKKGDDAYMIFLPLQANK